MNETAPYMPVAQAPLKYKIVIMTINALAHIYQHLHVHVYMYV